MASIIRSGKAGSDWNKSDLRGFNISTFFGIDHLLLLPVRHGILSNVDYPASGLPDHDDRLFFEYMLSAMAEDCPITSNAEESAVDDFAAHVFRI